MIYIHSATSFSQLCQLIRVDLTFNRWFLTVRVWFDVWTGQILLLNTGTPPRLGARGKEPSRVTNPVSMNSTTAIDKNNIKVLIVLHVCTALLIYYPYLLTLIEQRHDEVQ